MCEAGFGRYKAIVLDIEGTTTHICFVKQCLYTYCRLHLRSFLNERRSDPQTLADVAALGFLISNNNNNETLLTDTLIDEVEKCVFIQMDKDEKNAQLKTLQGHIWQCAYESGAIKGHIFDDVQTSIKRWNEQGIKVFIYSSGSIEAQKMLFKYSEKGNMMPYIAGNFDLTSVGRKQEVTSYEKIAAALGGGSKKKRDVLFLTDVVEEGKAAYAAGFDVRIVSRPGNGQLPTDQPFHVITSFDQIDTEDRKNS